MTKQTNIEAIYPLTPMQEGLLFHTLYADGGGVYVEQLVCPLHGDLDLAAFRHAWEQIVQRHPVLRTRLLYQRRQRPLQVVARRVPLPLQLLDWRDRPPAQQPTALAAWLAADRAQGFDLQHAPLLRLTLIRCADAAYHFVWSYHHLLLDGWSLSLVVRDLVQLYAAQRQGTAAALPPVRPFADYVAWLQHHPPAQAEPFWRSLLAGVATPTRLAAITPATTTPGVAQEQAILAAAATMSLDTLGRRHGLTLSTLLQGAWAHVLSRYSGEADVVFGVTVSGRAAPVAGIETMVGLFVNTVPLRARLAADTPLLPWLHALQAQQADAREVEHTPLVQIQSWSDIPSRLPLFETILAVENYPVDTAIGAQGAILGISEVQMVEQTNYPITVLALPGERLTLRMIYDPTRVAADLAAQILRHYVQLIETLPKVIERQLGDWDLLSDGERAAVLALSHGPARPYPAHASLADLFFAQAARTPDAPALLTADTTLTYHHLAAEVARLAHLLRAHGVGPEVRVGLALPRSPALITAVLAVWAAGAAYVPLDPAYPPARRQFILADAHIALVLTSQAHAAAGAAAVPHLVLDDPAVRAQLAAAPTAPPPTAAHPDQLAYVIYTSGSTGTPKGVLGLQRGALNRCAWMWHTYPFAPTDIACHKTALGFLDSLWEIAGPLLQGRPLLLVPEPTVADPHALLALLAAHRVTHLVLVPALLQTLLDAAPDLAQRLPLLHTWVTSGEALPGALAQRFLAQLPGRRLLNLYGASEISADATAQALTPAVVMPSSASVPIGRPIANTAAYVLDAHGRLLPPGVPGELSIGGVAVARGYHARPDLTAERFVPDPFGGEAGARLYRTGDRACWRADGTLDYLGRQDGQLQVRGVRIEPGEVEAVLRQHQTVAEAVVVGQGAGAERRLVAYVVGRDGPATVDGRALRQWLRAQVPPALVPELILPLAVLPRTPSGKLDRLALATSGPRSTSPGEQVAPRTPIEEVIVTVWSQLLDTPHIGVTDEFFELGGHSLLATQLVARLRDTFGVTLSVRSIFDAPTPRGLAEIVERTLRTEQGDTRPPLSPAPRDSLIPLSFAQQRLWFFDKLAPFSTAYNVSVAMRLRGQLDLGVLERSFATIVERHESLRTTFLDLNGEPFQVIRPVSTAPVQLIDLTDTPVTDRETRMLEVAAEEIHQPFDLVQGPLARSLIARLADDEYVFILTAHHIVSDHWSMNLFLDELTELYNAYTAERTPLLPELPIQYADFAYWQRSWLQDSSLERQLAYWVRHLEGAPRILELPTDHPRKAVQSFRGSRHYVTVPQDLTLAIRSLNRREGVTLFMTLLAAFQTLLMRYSGQTDIVVSTGIGNRAHEAIEHLIGCFINILVLRTDLSDNPRFSQLLQRVREICLNAYANQDLPFERLVEELQPVRDPSYTPLTQVMLVVRNAPRQLNTLANLRAEPLTLTSETSQFDLTFHVLEGAEQLYVEVEYNTDLFAATTIERLASHFVTLLAAATADPALTVADLPLLSADERRQIVGTWNATATDFRVNPDLAALFAQQVERNPRAVAVISGEQQITYGELDAQAARLAHHLQGMGVGPDVCVGILLRRSLEFVVAILGVLKAGGAYVPLDPAYPPDRLAFMLADARIPVLITRADHVENLPSHQAEIVLIDRDWPAIERHSAVSPPCRVLPQHLAYVIYTSGSTGLPKGVMVTLGGIVNNLTDLNTQFRVGPSDRTLALSSVSFDMCVYEVIGILVAGGAVVIPTSDAARDPVQWANLIRRHKVTIWNSAPPLLKLLLDLVEGHDHLCPESLRIAVLGGDWVPVTMPDRLRAVVPGSEVIVLGGATEASIHSIIYPVHQTDPTWKSIPYGRPMANQRAYILDERLYPTPVGVAGELYLGGSGLARGYFDRPALTAERFVPAPFGAGLHSEPGARIYRTGDLARYHADGTIELLGRIDYQVKIQGNRIELGEIEAVLRQHPEIRDLIVTVRDRSDAADDRSDKMLVAYLVLTAGAQAPPADLRTWLGKSLPDYMIPTAFVVLEALPLTPNGKVDRRSLPNPVPTRIETGESYVAPRNQIEDQLAATWREVLGIDQVGIDDNFFDLGGSSFEAIKVVTRVGPEISVVDLFQCPTIRELAQQITQRHPDRDGLLHRLNAAPEQMEATISIVCAPYGGGSAIVYHPLAQALPENYALYSIELPGHNLNRPHETLMSIEEVAQRCADEILSRISGPLVLYGHCAGTALALAIADRLEEANRPLLAIFLGGALPWYEMVDESTMVAEFDLLEGLSGVDEEQMRAAILKSMRHDVETTTRYFQSVRDRQHPPVRTTPIYCVVGDDDPYTPFYQFRYGEWKRFSTTVELRVVPGAEHYFIKHQARELAQLLVQTTLPLLLASEASEELPSDAYADR